jgi:hypothetical protein
MTGKPFAVITEDRCDAHGPAGRRLWHDWRVRRSTKNALCCHSVVHLLRE